MQKKTARIVFSFKQLDICKETTNQRIIDSEQLFVESILNNAEKNQIKKNLHLVHLLVFKLII